MNFLLHREIAHRELGDSTAGIGAMLPDLWRMAHRRARARSGRGLSGHEDQHALLRGVEHHLEADRWFHRTAVFTDGERETLDQLRAVVGVPKLALFAHVAWELCLDGAWLLSEGLQPAHDKLRADFAAVPASSFRAVARQHGIGDDWPDSDTQQFEARFHQITRELLAGRWIASYTHGSGLAMCVDGIRRRVGLMPMNPEQTEALAEVMESCLAKARQMLDDLLRARRYDGGGQQASSWR